MTPYPEWYPDPENTGLLRWWDGRNWTQQTRPASPRDPGPVPVSGSGGAFEPPAGDGHRGTSTAPDGHSRLEPPGSRLPPVGQLAQPVYAAPDAGRSRRRIWLIGGIGVGVLAAASAVTLVLTAVLGNQAPAQRAPAQPRSAPVSQPASPAPAPVALGAEVVDQRAGIGYRVPAGAGWQPIPAGSLGRWTLGYRDLAQRAGKSPGLTAVRAEAESAPLPSSYRYTGPRDLRSDGVQFANELASSHFAAPHTVEQLGISRHGGNGHDGARYVIEFQIRYPGVPARKGSVTTETAAVVIAGRGTGHRPGVLFVAAPGTIDVTLVPRIADTVVAAR